MIKQIEEINFPSYATLHQASASFAEMGERTISTEVRIDPSATTLDFSGWELRFKGERFILPILEPQAGKSNSSISPIVNLNFQSWVIYQLQRYLFMEPTSVSAGTVIADKYKTAFSLPIRGFVDLFNSVLDYYFNGKVIMDLYQYATYNYNNDPVSIEIDNSTLWDVLTKEFDLYKYRWKVTYNQEADIYIITVNYPSSTIDDHDFEYGYNGGLLKFERQVQDVDIRNILLGRGGEKNLPYRYFKREDPNNPEWAADPDAIPELQNIYFQRLYDHHFRWYVRGWMVNPNRDMSWENAGYVYPTYTEQDVPSEYLETYRKGKTDEKFTPVEYVKDNASIAKYGERWGALADDDNIYPTIQGIERLSLGRVDEVVDVSPILTDDIDEATADAATEFNVNGVTLSTRITPSLTPYSYELRGPEFVVPEGTTGNATIAGAAFIKVVAVKWHYWSVSDSLWWYRKATNAEQSLAFIESTLKVYDADTDEEMPAPTALPAGRYYYKILASVDASKGVGTTYEFIDVTFGVNGLHIATASEAEEWKPTFDIWVKNIWETTKDVSESNEQYAMRVWGPILGDRLGKEAAVVFSTGFMSISEDYSFVIASYPVLDRSKTITSADGNTYQSEWKITLYKSDAEYKTTGLYLPNASTGGQPIAGDHFFFTGIDMPTQYVQWAEEKLTDEKKKNLQETAAVNPTWVISLDKVRVHTLEDSDYGRMLADRLDVGIIVKTKDERFTNGDTLSLYVQNITYTWQEPSDNKPYIVPDIEVVLSDKIIARESPIAKLEGDISVVRSTYAKAADVEGIVRQVAGALYLGKTGEKQVSYSPTSFNSLVNSKDFQMGGLTGKGWGFYKDADGKNVLEVDRIIARQDLTVNELIANQVAYIGGKNIQSAAAIEVIAVYETEDGTGYVCKFDQKQGAIKNLFVVNDIAYSQVFDPSNEEIKFYKRLVTAVAEDSITLSKTTASGDGIPEVGDIIVQYGNTTDTNRQFVIITDVIGGGYQQMLSGLNSVSATGDEYYFAGTRNIYSPVWLDLQDSDGSNLLDEDGLQLQVQGRNTSRSPRWFVGDANGEYAEWQNGVLTVKGTFQVKKTDGSYVGIAGYLDTLDYLNNALPEASQSVTTITGGVVLSTIIGVQSNGNLVAGLNASSLGQDNTHGTLMIFAGATNAQQVANSHFKVYADGTVKADMADITGKITASSGVIGTLNQGGFEISSNGIKSTNVSSDPGEPDATLTIRNSYIQFLQKSGTSLSDSTYFCSAVVGSLFSAISQELSGINVLIKRNGNALFPGTTNNTGISIDVTGSDATNRALIIYNGVCSGIRPDTKRANTAGATVNLNEFNFNVTVTAACTIKLPSSPKLGQTYFFFYPQAIGGNGAVIDRNGNDVYYIGHGLNNEIKHTSFTGMAIAVYNGSLWYYIAIDNN